MNELPSADDDSLDRCVAPPAAIARRVHVSGRVQGVGFRPIVARLAHDLSLVGRVANTSRGATLWLEGTAANIDELLRRLPTSLPEVAAIQSIEFVELPTRGYSNFAIEAIADSFEPSWTEAEDARNAAPPEYSFAEVRHVAADPPEAVVPVDVRMCDRCGREARDAVGRRRDDLFISCTQCGPRYSIVERMPYERALGAMADFTPCAACAAEYVAPTDRRFHAQTVSCPACGPRSWFAAADAPRKELAERGEALRRAVAELRRGKIVALKGLGGYQLLVDATSPDAVHRLRNRKHRPDKPLAVLVADLAAARRCACLSSVEEKALASDAGPIVIVRRRDDGPLTRDVSGNLDSVGLMLPTTSLHAALVEAVGPLVATSGNDEGAPLAGEVDEAAERLPAIADFFLHHDRRIVRPIDDSVVRVIAERSVTIRLARGLAPATLAIPADWGKLAPESIVALGAHQKAAVSLWNGAQAILGPHVGDLDTLETRERYVEQLAALRQLYGCSPTPIYAGDRHPDYFTSQYGQENSTAPTPLLTVLHHHAHIVATMLEHEWLDEQVLGVAWDGTGWGEAATVWGGELSWCTAVGWKRIGGLRPLQLPGGEVAIRQPWRTATWMLRSTHEDGLRIAEALFGANRVRQLAPLGDGEWPGVRTTSIGRLFDVAAAIILPADLLPDGYVPYEGAAAMMLESYAWQDDSTSDPEPYPFPFFDRRLGEPDWPSELDWRPLLTALIADRRRGVEPTTMARRFHESLVAGLAAAVEQLKPRRLVLGGGVFQNRWLVERIARWAAERRVPLAFPAALPPNDGGIAAGQLAVVLARIGDRRPCA